MSSLIITDNFFWDLMNVFSVLKFHNSFPSTIEKHLITLSKSTVTNLSFFIAIFELNGDRLSFFQFSSPLSKFNEKIFERVSAAIILLSI